MDLYSVTTVMKEHDGYKNASFHWFYCDARTIPRPYADLIENYNRMNKLRAAYAEGYIDELFTLDEAKSEPGVANFVMNPDPTGSETLTNTTGISWLSRWTAAAIVAPCARITSGRRATVSFTTFCLGMS